MTAYISNEEFHVVRKRFRKPHASPGSIILGIVEEIDASIVDDSNDTAEPLARYFAPAVYVQDRLVIKFMVLKPVRKLGHGSSKFVRLVGWFPRPKRPL